MKAAILFTGSGPLAVLTSAEDIEAPDVVSRLEVKGLDKFMAFEVPLDLMRQRYGRHYTAVLEDSRQNDLLRVVDEDGGRIFKLFRLDELGPPRRHEGIPHRPLPRR